MARREIPVPVAIGIIVAIILVAVAIMWKQTSQPKEQVLKQWAPYPQIPVQGPGAQASR
ncbi:MAG: hypothetical protein HPY54_02450 [Chthonomonadetes bacterium]|nr:hypothetical protein [Chthonomonadetes bacterium]